MGFCVLLLYLLEKHNTMNDYERKLIAAFFIEPNIYFQNKNHLDLNQVFNNKYNKHFLQLINEYHQEYDGFPSVEVVNDIIQREHQGEVQKRLLDHFQGITDLKIDEAELRYIEDRIPSQIKENIIRTTQENAHKLSTDELKNRIEQIYTLSSTKKNFEIRNLWDDLNDIERIPIPTQLELIDEFGVAKGELGILLASTGVGKSVFLSYLANNFMLGGYKVLHIVFEGSIEQYHKAHLTKLKNPSQDELRCEVQYQNLKLVKMRANQTSVKDVEELIKSCITDGFIPDCLVIDYLDCIVIRNNSKNWENDIQIINDMEHLSQKYQVVIWTAVQANRSGTRTELSVENISGSITKAQKATMILALTRTPQQEEQNQADVKVIKNRTGNKRESINCVWNPKQMIIELPISHEVFLWFDCSFLIFYICKYGTQ